MNFSLFFFFNCTVCTAETPSAEAARAHANGTLSGRSRAAFPVFRARVVCPHLYILRRAADAEKIRIGYLRSH